MKITDPVVNDSLPKQLTIKEVSIIFGISEWTLRAYVSKRLIPHRRIGRRVYIPTDKLLAWLSKHDVTERSITMTDKSNPKEELPNV